MDRQQEFVLRTLEERDIRFVRLWFTDVLGTLKSVSVAPAELEAAFEEGIGFDGSAIEGFARVFESDMVAMPDPTTFQVFPFEGGGQRRERPDVLRHPAARRLAVLGRPAPRAAPGAVQGGREGLHLLHPPRDRVLPAGGRARRRRACPTPVDAGGYFDHTTHAVARDFRRQAVLALERIGISVEFSHHEVAPGQQEIDLRYADALTTADNIMTFRHVVKEVALSHGVHATFMPKPFTDQPGSGMHTHLSLFEGERNAFHDAGDPMKLSKVAQAFIAGLLVHAREYTAVTNQWVNSYKRLFPQALPDRITESPAYVCWGHLNRSALVRVPGVRQAQLGPGRGPLAGLGRATRTWPSRCCSAPASRASRRATSCRRAPRTTCGRCPTPSGAAMGYEALPENLSEAIDVMAGSELVAEVLGEHVFDFFLRNKRAEWEEYRREVTPYERQRYLSAL